MRIIHISDTHLSRRKPHFADNWPPLAAWIAAQSCDLVIHTGDVTVDGAGIEDDLRYAAKLMRSLGVRFRAVPGNHDVGDAGHPRQPVTDGRLARWRTYFGLDRWFEDVEGYRLVGLDAMLLGSGGREEAAQAAWLDGVMAGAGDRQIAWFRAVQLPTVAEDFRFQGSVPTRGLAFVDRRLHRQPRIAQTQRRRARPDRSERLAALRALLAPV